MMKKSHSVVGTAVVSMMLLAGCTQTTQEIEAEKAAFFNQARYGSVQSVQPAQTPPGKTGEYVAVTVRLDMTAENVTVVQPASMSNYMPQGERVSVGNAAGFGMAVSLINAPEGQAQ